MRQSFVSARDNHKNAGQGWRCHYLSDHMQFQVWDKEKLSTYSIVGMVCIAQHAGRGGYSQYFLQLIFFSSLFLFVFLGWGMGMGMWGLYIQICPVFSILLYTAPLSTTMIRIMKMN